MADRPVIGAVVIGRNEGDRLRRCLASIPPRIARVIYVDSGSTDGSQSIAEAAGAEVIALDMTRPFTAARARNAGFDALKAGGQIDFVHFIDGDCELVSGWVETAEALLRGRSNVAVACGRRRERHPEASVFNRLCDWEWNTPVGEAKACGGDALMRRTALDAVEGFDESLIAGEEPDLCLRMRQRGWKIWRLDHDMTLHDAAITRWSQWWARSRRSGHAFAEGAYRHGNAPEWHWVTETRRAFLWGLILPVTLLAWALLVTPWAWLGFLLYPLQILRLARRMGGGREAWERAFLLILGRVPEALGALDFHMRRLTGRRRGLIEYK